MGWCHEFGPQISEGCDHPMVAGATSCTCEECGANCTGKFAGCADVWARGPRLVAVRAIPSRPPRESRPATPANGATMPRVGPEGTSGEAAHPRDDEALRALLDELIIRCERLEHTAATVTAPTEADHGAGTASEAVTAVGRRLEELSDRLEPLEALPDRLEPLEGLPGRLEELETTTAAVPVAPAGDDLAAITREIKGFNGRLASLEKVAERLGSLDQERSRLAALDAGLTGLTQGWERLAGRVEALEAEPAPAIVAPKVDQAGSVVDPAELRVLADRLEALESMPPVEPRIPAELVKQMARLVSQVAALEQAPDRMTTLEQSVEMLASERDHASSQRQPHIITSHLERLATEVAPLRAVPKRMEAIERTQGRIKDIDKTMAVLAQRVGHLSDQVAATSTSKVDPETPPRIAALEAVVAELVQSLSHCSARVAGLDEVPKRVEALEQAVGPSERIVASLAKRVDRLSTQAASFKDLAARLDALEPTPVDRGPVEKAAMQVEGVAGEVQLLRRALDGLAARLQVLESAPAIALDPPSDRTDALVGGLGHAIDMIDQLAHQVAVLEEASSTPASSPPA